MVCLRIAFCCGKKGSWACTRIYRTDYDPVERERAWQRYHESKGLCNRWSAGSTMCASTSASNRSGALRHVRYVRGRPEWLESRRRVSRGRSAKARSGPADSGYGRTADCWRQLSTSDAQLREYFARVGGKRRQGFGTWQRSLVCTTPLWMPCVR